MSLKEWFFGRKLKEKETLAYILKKTSRIKELEKKCVHLEKLIREAYTDRNKLATRIMGLEFKMQKMEKKRNA